MIIVDIYYKEEHLNKLKFESWKDFLIWYPKQIEENPCLTILIENSKKTMTGCDLLDVLQQVTKENQ